MYYFYWDCGTSKTRGYLISNGKVIDKKQLDIGSKDVSVLNDNKILIQGLKCIYDELLKRSGIEDQDVDSLYASGMVTSPYGLIEVPHAVLPLNIKKIKDSIYKYTEETLFHRQINLIRGAKTEDSHFSLENIAQINNVRGEEIEVLGICNHIPRSWKSSKYVILLPGSHTHAILMENETIIDIFSIFSGEIFHALTNSTILSSSTKIRDKDTQEIDMNAVRLGCNYVKQYGFARAIYIVHAMKIFDVADNAKRRDCLSSIVISSVIQSLQLNLDNKWIDVNRLVVYANRKLLEIYLEGIKEFNSAIQVYPLSIEDLGLTCSVEGFLSLLNC